MMRCSDPRWALCCVRVGTARVAHYWHKIPIDGRIQLLCQGPSSARTEGLVASWTTTTTRCLASRLGFSPKADVWENGASFFSCGSCMHGMLHIAMVCLVPCVNIRRQSDVGNPFKITRFASFGWPKLSGMDGSTSRSDSKNLAALYSAEKPFDMLT